MRKWVIVGLLILLSVEESKSERYRRKRRRRKKEEITSEVKEKKKKKRKKRHKKFISIMPSLRIGGDYCDMNHYHFFKNFVESDTLIPKFLPSLHWFPSVEIGGAVIFYETFGGEIRFGRISKKIDPAKYKIALVSDDDDDTLWISESYQFVPSTTYLLFTYISPFSALIKQLDQFPTLKKYFKFVWGTVGLGICFASCKFKSANHRYIPSVISRFHSLEGTLKTTGIELHGGLRVHYPLTKNFLLGIEIEYRIARLRDFKGNVKETKEIQIDSSKETSERTFPGELIYIPQTPEMGILTIGDLEEIQQRYPQAQVGLVDFTGFKFGLNITFNF